MKRGYQKARELRNRPEGSRGGQAPVAQDYRAAPIALAAEDYLQSLEVRKLSPKTVVSRRRRLHTFLQWAYQRSLTEPAQITQRILESYQRHLHHRRKTDGQPLTIRTQREHLSEIKALFAWLCRQHRLEANPASELELPMPEKRLPPEPLTIAQINALLSVPDIADPLGIRNRAILETFYSTGIRRAELCRLQLGHLRRDEAVLFIRQGKGRKDRVVPLGQRALSWLVRYIDQARPLLLLTADTDTLFLTAYGEPFNPDVITRMVATMLRESGINRKGSCHLLRHTCATHMLEHGAELRYVQELLGHASPETTAIYTHVSIRQLKLVHAACHPAERPRPDAQ